MDFLNWAECWQNTKYMIHVCLIINVALLGYKGADWLKIDKTREGWYVPQSAKYKTNFTKILYLNLNCIKTIILIGTCNCLSFSIFLYLNCIIYNFSHIQSLLGKK